MKTTIIASGRLPEAPAKMTSDSKQSRIVTLLSGLFGVGMLSAAWISESTVPSVLLSGAGVLALAFALFRARRLAAYLPSGHTTDPHKLYSSSRGSTGPPQ